MNRRTPVRVVLVAPPGAERDLLTAALAGQFLVEVLAVEDARPARVVAVVGRANPSVLLLLDTGGPGAEAVVREVMDAAPLPICLLVSRSAATRSVAGCLGAGAVEALPVPAAGAAAEVTALADRLHVLRGVAVVRRTPRRPAPAPAPVSSARAAVVIGSSTGGPQALAALLPALAGLTAPVLVVQHIHAQFHDGLVTWLDSVCSQPVTVATQGGTAVAGQVYLAPPGRHLRLGGGGLMTLSPDPDLALHRPSVDELFASTAVSHGSSGVGVLLTGMGADGARGLLAMRTAGARTLGQDEASSVVFGMPRAAAELGAVGTVVSLESAAAAIRDAVAGIGRP